MAGKRGIGTRHGRDAKTERGESEYLRQDLEAGNGRGTSEAAKDRKYRFRDNVNLEVDDQRRVEFKKKLLAAIDDDKMENFRKSEDEIKKFKKKSTRHFYTTQNERLDDWLEVNAIVRALSDDILESFDPRDDNGDGVAEGGGGLQDTAGCIEPFLPEDEQQRRRSAATKAAWAININVVANIALLIAKGVAALSSHSLSLIASLVDSALDLLCTGIVFTTSKLVEWKITRLKRKFPVGRRRLEPLGILVFSILMIISFLKILEESINKLIAPGPHEATALPPIAIASQVATIVVKGVIGIGCQRIKTTQVQALWQVEDRVMDKLTFLAWRFSPLVLGYKSITAYHAGDGIWVEIDILLDEKTSLEICHDIAETLQYCAEAVPEVDRAFVTCDYATQGPTGHAGDGQ
ncbi:cation diffusion facilitator [Marssonina coronariae]|uniref:Cation diffusion facilitator n=1 Tax=Diplocarpon coronariae TaxID=2795749 RepID=A0A218YUE0_9HELO|nr:cation diffusion facilitator [Marssonina coronariae]